MISKIGSLPDCTIIGGPNGGGKSSIYGMIEPPGAFINADVVARQLSPENPEAASLSAGKQVLHLIDDLLVSREPFCYETTLSSHQSIKVLSEARLRGYRVNLVFVVLQDPELHVQRVKDRVLKGGHNIPELIIRRRYDLSFSNLGKAVPLCHSVSIFDNSRAAGPRLVVQLENRAVISNSLKLGSQFDLRIAPIVSKALGYAVDPIG